MGGAPSTVHHLVVVKRGSRLAQASVRRLGIRSAKPHGHWDLAVRRQ